MNIPTESQIDELKQKIVYRKQINAVMGCYQDVESSLNRIMPEMIKNKVLHSPESALKKVLAYAGIKAAAVHPISAALAP